jgi:hypothetical protein
MKLKNNKAIQSNITKKMDNLRMVKNRLKTAKTTTQSMNTMILLILQLLSPNRKETIKGLQKMHLKSMKKLQTVWSPLAISQNSKVNLLIVQAIFGAHSFFLRLIQEKHFRTSIKYNQLLNLWISIL